MKPEIWAALTAVCWGAGALLEKKGVKLGGFTPVMGVTIRTAVSLAILAAVSYPYWGQVRAAGVRPVLMIAVGGGVFAGALGILFLYTGLKSGNLSTVMTIAFCLTPVISVSLGYLFLGERLSLPQLVGAVLCLTGAVLITYFRR
jgi:uncharacterized membrane protein